MNKHTTAIRILNDAFRADGGGKGRLMVTRGVLTQPDLQTILAQVKSFDRFDEDNDPYSEHDFGAFDHGTAEILWKIDYYDSKLQAGSPDPADPSLTTRVLTVMLAEEC